MKDKSDAPNPPKQVALGMEVDFTAMPSNAPFPWLLQARVTMRAMRQGMGPATSHTEWFVLTPGMARQWAEDLQDAAARAEAPRPPEPTSMQ